MLICSVAICVNGFPDFYQQKDLEKKLMDCIILAGNRDSYREVSNKDNKAFLKIGEHTILHIIMKQLADVVSIDRLLVVGPKDALEEEVEAYGSYCKPVLIFDQKDDLVQNILSVVDATGGDLPPDRYVMVLPSDIPLITTEEINQFIKLCDMNTYDYVGGLTDESALSRFYPTEELPGVQMAYFQCQGVNYRINNLHMVRPSAIHNIEYIRKVYSIRYQKKLKNIMELLFLLLGVTVKIPGVMGAYISLQLSRIFTTHGWTRGARFFSNRLSFRRLEYYMSYILKARLKMVTTTYGGSAIDVDNDHDYHAINTRFQEWSKMLVELESDGDSAP